MIKSFLKSNKGFTLVELMVVVVIIGILALIAVPVYNNLTGQARQTACDANIKIITDAATLYEAQIGSFPTDISKLTDPEEGPDGNEYGPWLQDDPKCPFNGEYSIEGRKVSCSHGTE
ncbi:MAG: prepilin-type N-terminal cleavage/methylation domain-containing protein [Clostridiaceae bacterium]|nr:prepilin-type N-terminal cleavage/methylation domain-containing protein [Clostridiaceae bacterium]